MSYPSGSALERKKKVLLLTAWTYFFQPFAKYYTSELSRYTGKRNGVGKLRWHGNTTGFAGKKYRLVLSGTKCYFALRSFEFLFQRIAYWTSYDYMIKKVQKGIIFFIYNATATHALKNTLSVIKEIDLYTFFILKAIGRTIRHGVDLLILSLTFYLKNSRKIFQH